MSGNRANLHVAVVGYGSIGRRHVENLGRLGVGRRTAIRRAASTAGPFTPPPEVRVVSPSAALAQERPDAVIVCTPTSEHLADAWPWIEQRVPVLVEKPLAADLPAAEEFVRAVQALGRDNRGRLPFVAMAYPLRFHPAYLTAREMVARGTLGQVAYAKAWFESYLPDWHPWEDYRDGYAARRALGGGVLPTLDHELDFLAWCLGPVVAAEGWSRASGLLDMRVPDVAELRLRHAAGATSTVVLSLCRRRRARGFEIVGSDGELTYCDAARRLEHAPAAAPRDPPRVAWADADYDVNAMYLAELDEFLAAVEAHGRGEDASHEPLAPLAAGLAALRAAAAVRELPPVGEPGAEASSPRRPSSTVPQELLP